MLAVLYGLISAISFGISNVFWKTASKNNTYPKTVFFRGIVVVVILGLTWIILKFFNPTSFLITSNTDPYHYFIALLLCIVCSFGLLFFLKSFDYSKVGLIVPLSSINIFNILTAVLILHESFKTQYSIAILLSIIGIVFSQIGTTSKIHISWNRGATYSILASFFWGTSYALFKLATKWIGAIPLSFLLESTVLLMSLLWITGSKLSFLKNDVSKEHVFHYLILGVLLTAGTLFYNLSIITLPVILLNFLGYFSIILSILFARLFYNEKLKTHQIIGISLILVSIIVSQFP
jgi:drug/metabolite transporter (DMT)-like permease